MGDWMESWLVLALWQYNLYIRILTMNEFISPHQNINININYNLGQNQDKIPKVIFGKKVSKSVKTNPAEDSQVKLFKKGDIYLNKPQDHKPSTTKNQKHKKINMNFFTNSQELNPPGRRLKTEGNLNQQSTTVKGNKKQPRSSTKTFSKSVWHQKSLNSQTPLTKSMQTKKNTKNKKQNTKNRNKSCILYPNKKHIVSEVQHALSLAAQPKAQNKKRASSASVIRGDKFVDKLLNMSVLSSELGGSMQLHDDPKASAKKSSRGLLQDFMNSIDLRVVKKMQMDQQSHKMSALADLFVGEGLQLITYLNKIKRIPLQKLNQKATIIQRFWRRKSGESVIPYYRSMFRNVAMGLKTMQTEEISNIEIEDFSEAGDSLIQDAQSDPKTITRKDNFIHFEQKIVEGIEKIEEEESEGEHIIGQREEYSSSKESENKQQQGNSLNIEKYRQLVKSTIEKSKAAYEKVSSEESQNAHWNHVHNILSSNINQRGPIISNSVLEELMRQSAYNKQWIEGDFSSDSRKISNKQSPRVRPQQMETLKQEQSSYSRSGNSQEEQQYQIDYNWNKYSDISELKKPQPVGEITHNNHQVPSEQNVGEAFRESNKSNSNQSHEDEEWIRSQMNYEDGVVNEYLDCGLDNFGLKVGQQHPSSQNEKGQLDKKCQTANEELFSENQDGDESQKAFVFINEEHAKKNDHRDDTHHHLGQREPDSFQGGSGNDEDISQLVTKEINNKRVDKVTEDIISKLLEEFAIDVSNILRKSQNSFLSQENPNQRKVSPSPNHGILASFQTIRDFITNLKEYVLQSQETSQKVIQNLKNSIGPTSIEILSYLRVEPEGQDEGVEQKTNEEDGDESEEWLFVIPNQSFEIFHKNWIEEEEKKRGKKIPHKMKLYTQFWHRSIFQCFNECLDYERPFGITGAPYAWITEAKLPRQISLNKLPEILQNAENKILELSCSSSGIIFDKPDSPYQEFGLNEEARTQLNEERISRMLASEILDDEYNWITYNDEVTELMVDISRKIEQQLIFQVATDVKKISRRRKLFAVPLQENAWDEDQQVVFEIDEL